MKKQEYNAVLEKRFSPTWLTNEGLDKIGEMIRFDTFYGIVSSNFHESIMEVITQYEMVVKFKDDIKFCKIDIDDYEEIAKQFGVRHIPTILLFPATL